MLLPDTRERALLAGEVCKGVSYRCLIHRYREKKGIPHLAFSKGIHSCLGAPLARLEGQVAIGTLLKRLPHLRLANSPERLIWNRTLLFRGLTSLPVTF